VDLHAPYGITVDADGSIYTAEVVTSAALEPGGSPPTWPAIRKFVRIAA
jgi:hypothetical protein